jgi:hypothetical protein
MYLSYITLTFGLKVKSQISASGHQHLSSFCQVILSYHDPVPHIHIPELTRTLAKLVPQLDIIIFLVSSYFSSNHHSHSSCLELLSGLQCQPHLQTPSTYSGFALLWALWHRAIRSSHIFLATYTLHLPAQNIAQQTIGFIISDTKPPTKLSTYGWEVAFLSTKEKASTEPYPSALQERVPGQAKRIFPRIANKPWPYSQTH